MCSGDTFMSRFSDSEQCGEHLPLVEVSTPQARTLQQDAVSLLGKHWPGFPHRQEERIFWTGFGTKITLGNS